MPPEPKKPFAFSTLKLPEVVVLSVSTAFVFIGLHQSITLGFSAGYTLFMFSLCGFIWFRLMLTKRGRAEKSTKATPEKSAARTGKGNKKIN